MRKTIQYLLYLPFILPLLFTPFTRFPWHFGKTILFQGYIEVVIVAVILLMLWRKIQLHWFQWNLLDSAVLLLNVVLVVSAASAYEPTRAFFGDQSRVQGVFTLLHFVLYYYLLRLFFSTKDEWYRYGAGLLGISFLVNFFSWIGTYTSVVWEVVPKDGRLAGWLGNPIFFASYLIIPFFFGIAWFFLYPKRVARWMWLFASIASGVSLYLTRTRGALFGVALGTLSIWFDLLFLRSIQRKYRIALGIGGMGVVFVIVGLFFFNRASPWMENHFSSASYLFRLDISSGTAATRLLAWGVGWKAFLERPIIGWGPENFQHAFEKNYISDFLKFSFAETVWDKPHNIFVQYLTETGIIGLTSFLFLVAVGCFYIQRIIRGLLDLNEQIALVVLGGGFIAYLVQNAFAFETSNSLLLWYVLLAFVGSTYQWSFGHGERTRSMSAFSFLYSLRFFIGGLLVIAMIFSLYTYHYLFLKNSYFANLARHAQMINRQFEWKEQVEKTLAIPAPFQWENAIFFVQDLSFLEGRGTILAESVTKTHEQIARVLEEKRHRYPDMYLPRFWLGELYSFVGEYANAIYFSKSEQVLREAWNLNRARQHPAVFLGKVYLVQSKPKEAIAVLEEVVGENSSIADPWWLLALSYSIDGNIQKSTEALDAAAERGYAVTAPRNFQFTVDVYTRSGRYATIALLFEQLIASDPANPKWFIGAATIYGNMKNYEKMEEYLNRAVFLEAHSENAAQEIRRQFIQQEKKK